MNIRHRCRLGANSMVVPTDAPEYTHTCELIAQRGTFGPDWYWDVSRYGVEHLSPRMAPNRPAFGVCRWRIATTVITRAAGQHATGG